MKTTNIEALTPFLADEAQFPAHKGHRDPASPSFCFFDDEIEVNSDLEWGRHEALDFEEWKANLLHAQILMDGTERRAERIKTEVTFTPACESTPLLSDNGPKVKHKPATKKDAKRTEQLTGNPISSVSVSVSHEDDFVDVPDASTVAYFERQESRGYANWLVQFHKQAPANNDRWRTLVAPLVEHMDDPEIGDDCKTVFRVIKQALPFAQGPVKGTKFVNPDGSVYETAGTNPGTARASYQKRHKLEDEFLSVTRVQKEGVRHSHWVIGQRRTSDKASSRYYDPNPQWMEKTINGEWVKAYNPVATTLFTVAESMVMPSGSHRLTVREFEQSVIAGSDLLESEDEHTAIELESEYLPDSRLTLLNMGYGSATRDTMALSHEESYLHGIFQMFGARDDDPLLVQACELLCLEVQEPGTLAMHFKTGSGHSSEVLHEILKFVKDDDERRAKEGDTDRYFKYVVNALTAVPEADIESRADAKSVSRDNIRLFTAIQRDMDQFIKTRTLTVTRARELAQEEREMNVGD